MPIIINISNYAFLSHLISFTIEFVKYFLIIATTFSLNFTNLTTLTTSQSDNENDLEELL